MFPLLCMYPPDVPSLLVHPTHCCSPFCLLPKIYIKKISLLLLQNLRVPVSFINSSFHLFLWNPFSFSSPFGFHLFSLLHFPILFFRKITFLSPFFVFFFKKQSLTWKTFSFFIPSLFVFVHHVSHSPPFFVSVFAWSFYFLDLLLELSFFTCIFFSFLRTTISPPFCIKIKPCNCPFYMHSFPLYVLLLFIHLFICCL